jgi:hypothetical protein
MGLANMAQRIEGSPESWSDRERKRASATLAICSNTVVVREKKEKHLLRLAILNIRVNTTNGNGRYFQQAMYTSYMI